EEVARCEPGEGSRTCPPAACASARRGRRRLYDAGEDTRSDPFPRTPLLLLQGPLRGDRPSHPPGPRWPAPSRKHRPCLQVVQLKEKYEDRTRVQADQVRLAGRTRAEKPGHERGLLR